MPENIPKKIHFIWVGGPIEKEDLVKINTMAVVAKESGFEINLWVDKESNYEKTAAKEDIYIKNLKIRNIKELKNNMKKDPFYKSNTGRLKKFEGLVGREMVGLKNLAAASDLLRYEILRQEGGYYFDIDSLFFFNEKSILSSDNPKHGFLCSAFYRSDYLELNGGNDIIGSIPNHEILENAILKAMVFYQDLDTNKSLLELLAKQTNSDIKLIKMLSNKFKNQQKTLMDKKREYKDKYESSGLFNEDRKHLTLSASGPELFYEAVTEYRKKNSIPSGSLCFERKFNEKQTNVEAEKYSVAGISVTSTSQGNWTKKPKLPRSFDDLGIFYHSKSNLKSEKTKSEDISKSPPKPKTI